MTDVLDRAKLYLLDSDMEESGVRRAQADPIDRAKAFLARPPDETYAAVMAEPDEPDRIKQAANAFLRAIVQNAADIPNSAALLKDYFIASHRETLSSEVRRAMARDRGKAEPEPEMSVVGRLHDQLQTPVETLRSMARRHEAERSGAPAPEPEFKAVGDDEASLAGLGRAIERWGKETFPDDERLRDEWIATKIPGAFGSMVSFLVGGAASKLAKVGGKVGAAAVGASSGAMGQRRDAELHNATPEAKRMATIGGAAVGALDAVLPGKLLGESGLARTVGKAALTGARTEALQEGVQGVGQEALARLYDPDRTAMESAKNIAEQVALGGIVGGGTGAAFGVQSNPPSPPSVTTTTPTSGDGATLEDVLGGGELKAVPGAGKRYAKRPDTIIDPKSQFPEAEAALQQAEKGIQRPSLRDRIKEWSVEKWHAASRLFPRLNVENKNDAVTHVALREFMNAPSWATATAAEQTLRVTEALGPKQRSLFQRIVGLRDHLREADADRKTLPLPGYPDLDAMRSDLARWESLAQATPAVKQALEDRSKMNRDLVSKMLSVGVEGIDKNALDNVDTYVHRQVLKYFNLRKSLGLGLFTDNIHTKKKGFQKSRKPEHPKDADAEADADLRDDGDDAPQSASQFNLNYEQSEFEWKAHALYQIAVKEAQNKVKRVNDIADSLKAEAEAIQQDTGKEVSWTSLVPDGYVIWQPKPGNAIGTGLTIEEEIADQILGGTRTLSAEDLSEKQVVHGPLPQWVIPEHVAKTLDSMPRPKKEGFLLRLHTRAYSAVKKMQLASPPRILRYLVTNQISDASAAFAADPAIFRHWRKAASLMARANTGEATPREMEYYQSLLKQDVVGSTITAHEIQDIDYQDIYDAARGTRPLRRPIKWYFEKVGKLMTGAEGVTRLAAYERALELLSQGKRPLWASKASLMRNLYDSNAPKEVIAAQLSRDLFIDYRGLPGWVADVSRHAVPYARWLFGNMPRYARLIANAARTGDARSGVAAGASATASLFARLSALHVATHIWNALFFPDEYKELRQGQRSIGIIVGKKNADGYIPSIRVSDGFKEILEFAGLSDAAQDVEDVRSGRSTLWDKAMETVRAPVEKLWFSAIPIERSVMETVVGKKTQYPHLFQKGSATDIKTLPVRDRAEELLRPVALDWVYRKVTGKPLPEHERTIPSGLKLAYWTDPGEASYYAIRDRAYSWLQERGISPPMIEPTNAKAKEKSDALYYWKKAVQVGDEAARKRWLKAYFEAGGTVDGMRSAVSRTNPLGVIPDKYRAAFVRSLTPQERDTLRLAAEWSARVKRGK